MGLQVRLSLLLICFSLSFNEGAYNQSFPKGFFLGAATASYQIEGAWNEDGKGPSVWDWLTHTFPEEFEDNGDVACDSYHKWRTDVNLLNHLGVDMYRFSISWSRILPNGMTNKVNQAGIDYYRNIIRALKSSGIEPFITLYHWDIPLFLEELGGWQSERSVDWFADYARLVFKLFGNDVKYWATFNEPYMFCQISYTGNTIPNKFSLDGVGNYICAHNVLKSHARAYHIFHDELKQSGKVGIVLNADGGFIETDSVEDQEALDRWLQFSVGLYAHPIFTRNGNYPQVVIDRVGTRSKLENFPRSRLPEFTQQEIDYIRGSADFFGLNHYTSRMIKHADEAAIGDPAFSKDVSVTTYANPAWDSSGWVYVVPEGLRMLLNYFRDNYNSPPIIITENGISDTNKTVDDDFRVNYYREYMSAVLDAIYEDKVNVFGHLAWSFLDNYEWGSYATRFGIVHVNFNNPDRPRTPKKSANYIKTVIANRCLIHKCE